MGGTAQAGGRRPGLRVDLSAWSPALAGVLDAAAAAGYLFPAGPRPLQLAALLAKLLLLVAGGRSAAPIRGAALFCLGFTALMTLSDLFSPYHDAAAIVQLLAFGTSLFLTAALCAGVARTALYLQALATFLALLAALYLALCALGRIEDAYGRYLFFGGSHPNLGAETFAFGIVAAGLSWSGPALLWRSALMFPPIVLMQGRSGMITAALALTMRGILHLADQYRARPRRTLAIGLAAAPLLLFLTVRALVEIVSTGLMLDDPNRGAGTNLVGRGDRWEGAWRLFQERPLLGNGPGVFAATGLDTAHDFFMYGLCMLGCLFLVLLAMMAARFVVVARTLPRAALVMSTLGAMLIFNDRFANLNVYPFGLYVLLLTLSAPTARATTGRFSGPALQSGRAAAA